MPRCARWARESAKERWSHAAQRSRRFAGGWAAGFGTIRAIGMFRARNTRDAPERCRRLG